MNVIPTENFSSFLSLPRLRRLAVCVAASYGVGLSAQTLNTAAAANAVTASNKSFEIKFQGKRMPSVLHDPTLGTLQVDAPAADEIRAPLIAAGLTITMVALPNDVPGIRYTVTLPKDAKYVTSMTSDTLTIAVKVPVDAAISQGEITKKFSSKLEDALIHADYQTDLPSPGDNGLSLIGVGGISTKPAKTPREITVALGEGRSSDGKLKAGVGISFTPSALLGAFSAKQPAASPPERISKDKQTGFSGFDGINITLATAQGKEQKDDSIKVGASIEWTFYDLSRTLGYAAHECFKLKRGVRTSSEQEMVPTDTYADKVFSTHLGSLKDAVFEGARGGQSTTTLRRLRERTSIVTDDQEIKDAAACETSARKLAWVDRRASIGFGQAFFTETGFWRDRTKTTSAVWFSGTERLASFTSTQTALAIDLHLRATQREQFSYLDPLDSSKSLPGLRNTRLAATRLAYGDDLTKFALDASYARNNNVALKSEGVKKFGFGFERRISDTFWIKLGAGTVSGSIYGKNKPFALTTLQYGAPPAPAP